MSEIEDGIKELLRWISEKDAVIARLRIENQFLRDLEYARALKKDMPAGKAEEIIAIVQTAQQEEEA